MWNTIKGFFINLFKAKVTGSIEEIDITTNEKLCYNCGYRVTNGNHGEHIPPRCLYDGRDDSYKVNRYKIPACHNCNNGYSKIDEEFRNLIGVITKQPGHDELIKSTVKSMNRGIEKSKRIMQDNATGLYNVAFKPADLIEFHQKNFKGVYYVQYGKPLPKNYKILVDINIPKKEYTPKDRLGIDYLLNSYKWKFSGHPDIFSYIIQPLRIDYVHDGNDIPLAENERIIFCLLRYNKSHTAFIAAECIPQP